MQNIIDWCRANPELVALIVAAALPHVRALIPAQAVPVLDLLVGNCGNCRNAKPTDNQGVVSGRPS